MTEPRSEERRRAPRAPVTFKIRVEAPSDRQSLTARDLSYEGVFIECSKPMRLGTRVECRLELPRESSGPPRRIEFTAEVRHHSSRYLTSDGQGPYRGVGVRITRIGTDDQATLRATVDQILAALGGA